MRTSTSHCTRWRPNRPAWSLLGLALLATAWLVCGCGGGAALEASGAAPLAAVAGTASGGPPGPPDVEEWLARLDPAPGVRPAEAAASEAVSDPEEQVEGYLELQDGWNLVCLPLARVTALDPGATVLEYGFSWDPATGTYHPLDLRNPTALAGREGIGRGLWVLARQADRLHYRGLPDHAEHTAPEVSLVPGWNLVGFPHGLRQPFARVQVQAPRDIGLPVALPDCLGRALADADPQTLILATAYTLDAQGYRVLDLGDPSGAFEPGRALWVYAYHPDTVLRYGQGAQENLASCRANLMALATAARLHAMDNSGHYPADLSELKVRHYLASIPTCPSARAATYLDGYQTNSNPDAFTVYCKKANHTGAGIPEDYPRYGSWRGLIDRQAP